MSCQEFRKEVDAVYPEPLSRLHRGPMTSLALDVHPVNFRRHQRKALHRAAATPGTVGRYRTQPVTFDEIKEVDEDTNEDPEQATAASGAQSEEDLMQQKFQKLRLRNKARFGRIKSQPQHQQSQQQQQQQQQQANEEAESDEVFPSLENELMSTREEPMNFRSQPRPSI